MKENKQAIIGVIGQGRGCSKQLLELAEDVGREIAKKNATLICGGLKGVMEAACRGAKKEHGITIGVLPGTQKTDANKYVDIPIVTGLGEARNSTIVRTADVLIAVGGRYGTLSEIAFALAFGKSVVGLKTWENIKGIAYVETPQEALKAAFRLLKIFK